jgi:hypothetical protein
MISVLMLLAQDSLRHQILRREKTCTAHFATDIEVNTYVETVTEIRQAYQEFLFLISIIRIFYIKNSNFRFQNFEFWI